MSSELDESPCELRALDVGAEGDEATLGAAAAGSVMRHLFETGLVPMWSTKPDGEPCYLDQRLVDYTGRTLNKLLDRGWKDLIHPEDEERVVAAWSHAIRSSGYYQDGHRLRRADGQYRWFLVQGVPLLDLEGRVTRFFGMITQLAFPPSTGIRPPRVSLSERERTIVIMMGHGLSNKRIARELGIAPETVKWHAKNIYCKLTAQTRAQAVYRASALGIIVDTGDREQGSDDWAPTAAMRR